MLTKDTLITGFEELTCLYRYLYTHPDSSVKFVNAIDVPLELTMTDDTCLMIHNLNFPDSKPTVFQSDNHIDTMMAIIEQQKEMPSETPGFRSRWDEIRTLTGIIMTLNKSTRTMI